jgi:4-hydroxybenzoyl-CoA thioesterase
MKVEGTVLHIHETTIQFGDCDPAGIVFFPNFLRWMDESSLAFFMARGVPPWRELVKTRGIVGTPLLEIHTKFYKSATYAETIQVHTTVEDWQAKVFRHRHRIFRGDTLLCEGTEVRAFVERDPGPPERLRAIPVPEDIRALCS